MNSVLLYWISGLLPVWYIFSEYNFLNIKEQKVCKRHGTKVLLFFTFLVHLSPMVRISTQKASKVAGTVLSFTCASWVPSNLGNLVVVQMSPFGSFLIWTRTGHTSKPEWHLTESFCKAKCACYAFPRRTPYKDPVWVHLTEIWYGVHLTEIRYGVHVTEVRYEVHITNVRHGGTLLVTTPSNLAGLVNFFSSFICFYWFLFVFIGFGLFLFDVGNLNSKIDIYFFYC